MFSHLSHHVIHPSDLSFSSPPLLLFLLASVKLCLGSRVAVLGANGAGEQQRSESHAILVPSSASFLLFALETASRGYGTTLVICAL